MALRRINDAGLELIKAREGLELAAYQDSVGVWTIGYGHTRGVRPGMVITPSTADALLVADLREAERDVTSLVRVPVTDNQFAALVSLCFNIGTQELKSSTLLSKLNRGDYAGAADQFLRWDHAGKKTLPGLLNRREEERELFLNGSWADVFRG